MMEVIAISESANDKQSQDGNHKGTQLHVLPTTPEATTTTYEEPVKDTENKMEFSQHLVGSVNMQLQLSLTRINEINTPDHDNNNATEHEKPDKEEVKLKNKRTGWRRYIGIIFGISSSIMFTLGLLIVKLLPEYNPYTTTLWKFQGVLLPALPMMFYCRVVKNKMIFDMILPITGSGQAKSLLLLFVRAVAGASAFILQFYSLQYISMADGSVIVVSTPVFVSLASHFLLGEKSGVIPIICGVITLVGVGVIARPPILTGEGSFDNQILIGTGLASCGMICVCVVFLLLRYLRQMHVSVATASFGLWGTIQCLALAVTISKFQLPQSYENWGMAAAVAICAFFEQGFLTLAFKYEQAGVVSLCRTLDGLFAHLWQFVILGEVPDSWSLIGGGIVIFGVLVAGLRKYLSELPEDSLARKRFWILLA